jgi:integrase
MGDCGLRTGEVIALEWSHVRWSPERQLVIQRAHWRGHFGPPKGGRPRTVPMTDRVAAALRGLPRSLAGSWVLGRERQQPGEAGHETHASLGWALGKVERAAGFGKRASRGKLHKLRHTFVTRLAAAGVLPLSIRDLAGHTRLETTMRYMHLLPGAGSRAVEALQAFDKEHHRSTATPPIAGSAS